MVTLNRSSTGGPCNSRVGTDVTGFGLGGHAREMALASNVTFEIAASKVKFLPGAIEYSKAGGTVSDCVSPWRKTFRPKWNRCFMTRRLRGPAPHDEQSSTCNV